MGLGWINPEDYSFNSFLLLERFQIRLMMDSGGWRNNKEEWRHSMGVALKANPAVMWYFKKRCPECSSLIDEITSTSPMLDDLAEVRKAEVYALASVEDFTIYTTPELMAANCDFISGWRKDRLYDLVDLTNKTVLDVGAGSGRLTFAAAEKAAWVYASEPVGTLREFMRDKIASENIMNIRVLDGFITHIPFPDDTFDIVMSGHVINDDINAIDAEIAELTRVCKSGGWLIDCRGDSKGEKQPMKPNPALTARGWEEIRYVGSFGYDVFNHRKQVWKG